MFTQGQISTSYTTPDILALQNTQRKMKYIALILLIDRSFDVNDLPSWEDIVFNKKTNNEKDTTTEFEDDLPELIDNSSDSYVNDLTLVRIITNTEIHLGSFINVRMQGVRATLMGYKAH